VKIPVKLTLLIGVIFIALMIMPAGADNSGCVSSAKGPVVNSQQNTPAGSNPAPVTQNVARIGQVAPDFEAGAYHQGGFKNLKLSDFRGKWVLLCFYPGDFTFV